MNPKNIRNILSTAILFITAFGILLSNSCVQASTLRTKAFQNSITLNSFEYHIVSINATEKEVISGDFMATPSGIVPPPFLVFIVDSENLAVWEASDNLTQAVKRIPSEKLLYLYDPYLIPDDIPFDNQRAASFQKRVPESGTWHLVFYAGASPFLQFSWNLDVFAGVFFDIAIYTIVGIIVVGLVITIFIVVVKRRKQETKDEIEVLLEEQQKLQEQRKAFALGTIEEVSESELEEANPRNIKTD